METEKQDAYRLPGLADGRIPAFQASDGTGNEYLSVATFQILGNSYRHDV